MNKVVPKTLQEAVAALISEPTKPVSEDQVAGVVADEVRRWAGDSIVEGKRNPTVVLIEHGHVSAAKAALQIEDPAGRAQRVKEGFAIFVQAAYHAGGAFAANRYFSELTPAEYERIRATSTARVLAKGERLFAEGDRESSGFLILAGTLSVTKRGPDGKESPILRDGKPISLGKGEVIGLVSLFDDAPRQATAIANEPVVLIEMDGKTVREIMGASSPVEQKVRAEAQRRHAETRSSVSGG